MSHTNHNTRTQDIKRLNWVFYQPDHTENATFYSSHLYRIQERDLEEWMIEWVPQAFANDIRHRYGFNIDERAIWVAKVSPFKIILRLVELTTADSPTTPWISSA